MVALPPTHENREEVAELQASTKPPRHDLSELVGGGKKGEDAINGVSV